METCTIFGICVVKPWWSRADQWLMAEGRTNAASIANGWISALAADLTHFAHELKDHSR